MKTVWALLVDDLRLNLFQMSWEVLLALIGGCIFYLGLGYGIMLITPQILSLDTNLYLSGSVVVVVTFLFGLVVSQAATIRQFASGQINNLRAANLSISEIYVGKSLVYLIQTIGAMILVTATIFILGHQGYRLGPILLFWFTLILGGYLAVQIGLLLGCMTNIRLQLVLTNLIILPLLLLSNFITPINLWRKGLAYAITMLPSSILITNCRLILVDNRVHPLALIYLLMLNVVFLAIGVYIYKRKLLR